MHHLLFMTTAAPLHLGTINGHSVRFFRPPDARHELPWHAIDDLHGAMELTTDERAYFLRCAKASPWAATDTATIATEAGPVPIGTHRLALSFIHAMIEIGRSTKTFESDYLQEGTEALTKLIDNLPPDAVVHYVRTAFVNTHGGPDEDDGGVA